MSQRFPRPDPGAVQRFPKLIHSCNPMQASIRSCSSPLRRSLKYVSLVNGFSLVELLLSALISSSVIMAAAFIAISETKASIKTYAMQTLRDKYARLVYFIETEVSEGKELSVSRNFGSCPVTPTAPAGVTAPVQYLFTLKHDNSRAQGLASSYTCFFNVPLRNNPGTDPSHWSLYRYGPAIGDRTGVIGLSTGDSAIPASLNPGLYVLSPYAYVYNVGLNRQADCGSTGLAGADEAIRFSCDGRSLTFSVKVATGTDNRSIIWNSTYPPGDTSVRVYSRSRLQ